MSVFPPRLTPTASSGGGAGYSATWTACRRKITHQRGQLAYVNREWSNFHHSPMTKPAAMTTTREEKSERTGEVTEIKQLRFGYSRPPAAALT